MDYEKLGLQIINLVGGKDNINNLVHCVTRLRFSLNDRSKAKTEQIKELDGVITVVETSQQYQVVIGNDVNIVYDIIMKQLGYSVEDTIEHSNNNTKEKLSIRGSINKALTALSEILTPLVPALAASGMLKVILLILSQTHILSTKSTTYIILTVISDAVLTFLPIITAYLAAEYFKTNKVLAMVFASALIHPTFMELLTKSIESGKSIDYFSIPVLPVKYVGSIIPALLMVLFMVPVEKFAEKISPKMIKVFFKPLLMMLIIPPVTFIVLGPIGDLVGTGIGNLTTFSFNHFGGVIVGVLAAFLPFAVLTGLNRALTPISIQIMAKLGHEPIFRVAYIGTNMAQGAAALAVGIKSKNKKTKQLAFSSATATLISGVTEPSLYGVNLKFKTPLIAASIGGGIAGVYAGLTGVTAYAMAIPGISSIGMFIGPNPSNLINAIISYVIAIVSTFVLTLVIGFKEDTQDTIKNSSNNSNRESNKTIDDEDNVPSTHKKRLDEVISEIKRNAPIKGKITQLSDVPDDVFSSELMGKGFAIEPSEGLVTSPFNGVVSAVFPSKHAIGLTSEENGAELLIHVGVDTVQLNGEGYEMFVKEGDKVKIGDTLLKFDVDFIKQSYNLITPIIITNPQNFN